MSTNMTTGALVQMLHSDKPYYHAGDHCVLDYMDGDGTWWADFNNCGNAAVYMDGEWNIGDGTQFTLITEKPTAPVTPIDLWWVARIVAMASFGAFILGLVLGSAV